MPNITLPSPPRAVPFCPFGILDVSTKSLCDPCSSGVSPSSICSLGSFFIILVWFQTSCEPTIHRCIRLAIDCKRLPVDYFLPMPKFGNGILTSFSANVLPFSTGVFVLYVKFGWMALSVGTLAESVSDALSFLTSSCTTLVNLFGVEASSGTLARSSRQLLFLLDGDPTASLSSLKLVDTFRSSPRFICQLVAVWLFDRLVVWPFGCFAFRPFGHLPVWPSGRVEKAMTIVVMWRYRLSVVHLSALCKAVRRFQKRLRPTLWSSRQLGPESRCLHICGRVASWDSNGTTLWPFGQLAVWPFCRFAVWLFCLWPFARLAVWPLGKGKELWVAILFRL